jgi:hypothetical protein
MIRGFPEHDPEKVETGFPIKIMLE